MPGRLYVVSTPIGNLDDITIRALNTLKSVAVIAAEDTRRTGTLLRHFGIPTPTTSLHEHNERQKVPQLVRKLVEGSDIALVSDAGTPLVSDPGQRLISASIEASIPVIPIPGPSAVLSALVTSGFSADSFVFAGFAPSRSKDRIRWLRALQIELRPIVFFESPHRIISTLDDISHIFVNRPISVAREHTKVHEETLHFRSNSINLACVVARGEFTVVIGPGERDLSSQSTYTDDDVRTSFDQLTHNKTTRRQALAETGKRFGLSTNQVYAILERIKDSSAP